MRKIEVLQLKITKIKVFVMLKKKKKVTRFTLKLLT
jgi:hypothetical protein